MSTGIPEGLQNVEYERADVICDVLVRDGVVYAEFISFVASLELFPAEVFGDCAFH